ncbi:hypothetical protein ES707_16416 [subsurface metagenome]
MPFRLLFYYRPIVDGRWYISHCGWDDGLDEADTSLPVPRMAGERRRQIGACIRVG